MKNTAIKEAIQKHLKKDNVDELQFYNSLLKDMEKLNTYRDMVDNELLNLRRIIEKSNFHILIDKIIKEDIEGIIEILKNTKDRIIFFDFIDNFSKCIVLFEQYTQVYEFNYPDLEDIKETFALRDDQLHQLIKEISLDSK